MHVHFVRACCYVAQNAYKFHLKNPQLKFQTVTHFYLNVLIVHTMFSAFTENNGFIIENKGFLILSIVISQYAASN